MRFTILGWSGSSLPLIFLWRREHVTIALGLTYFLDRDRRLWDLATAGDTMADTAADAMADAVADLPVISVLVLAQRAFIAGIALTGIKG